jgi:hypothetical protein
LVACQQDALQPANEGIVMGFYAFPPARSGARIISGQQSFIMAST